MVGWCLRSSTISTMKRAWVNGWWLSVMFGWLRLLSIVIITHCKQLSLFIVPLKIKNKNTSRNKLVLFIYVRSIGFLKEKDKKIDLILLWISKRNPIESKRLQEMELIFFIWKIGDSEMGKSIKKEMNFSQNDVNSERKWLFSHQCVLVVNELVSCSYMWFGAFLTWCGKECSCY